jgi:predicted CopG family antitoxin
MPSLSVYIEDEVYSKLLASKESPSALVKRLLEEYFAKVESHEVFEILAVKFWDKENIHILLDRSKPKNEQFVMQSKDLREIKAFIKRIKSMNEGT